MRLLPDETYLKGEWVLVGERVVANEVCARIEELAQNHLRKIGHDASGWDTLFVDPDDGRLWELVYPDSGLSGGGPPELRVLDTTQAKKKYALLSLK